MITIWVLIAIVAGALVLLGSSVRVITQYERGVVFRFGRVLPTTRGPGLALIAPIADRLHKVNMQIITQPVPAQDGITRDNVTVRVDAVIYYRVVDPVRVAVDVQDYGSAILQVAQASLRSIIGKSELDDLLSNRERLNQGLELMIDNPAVGWGVHIDRVEIKDVALPESMKRSMSRQAEAERERRSRVITAEGELQASRKLAEAAEVMTEHPAALQLRLLQTVVEVAAESNSTLVLPFPVELLRFLERATPADPVEPAAIAHPRPRSEPSDTASTTAEPTGAAGAWNNGAASRPDSGHPGGGLSDEPERDAGPGRRRDRRHRLGRRRAGLGGRRGRGSWVPAARRARLPSAVARRPVLRCPGDGRPPPGQGRGGAGVGAGDGPRSLGRPRHPGDNPAAAGNSRPRPARRGP